MSRRTTAAGGNGARTSRRKRPTQRGCDLHAGTGRAVAAVGEAVHAAGRHDDGLTGRRDDLARAETEDHRALEHLEALLLLGVDVSAGDVPVRRELELELEQLAAGVGRGAEEVDPLAAHGIADGLSCVSHCRAPCRSVWQQPLAAGVSRRRAR
jgi:hypothetical protein